MKDALKVAGCSRDVFNKWLDRGYLKTRFRATSQGVRRTYSRENLLELSFLAALTGIGLAASEAAVVTRAWLKQAPPLYAYNPVSKKGAEFPTDTLTLQSLRDEIPDDGGAGEIVDEETSPSPSMPADFARANAISVIYPQAIVARVDAYIASRAD